MDKTADKPSAAACSHEKDRLKAGAEEVPMFDVRRREFITLLAGAAAWPLAARAQQADRVRRVATLTGIANEAGGQERFTIFVEALGQLGWIVGRNLRIESRWGGGDASIIRKHAAELVALAPVVIMATGGAPVGQLLQITRIVPIVFTAVPDPVGSGFVNSLSRPGGYATGFLHFEYSLAGKWLELLREIVPGTTRAAIIWDPSQTAAIGQFAVIQAIAPALGVEVFPINVRHIAEAERGIAAFVRNGGGGMIVTASALTVVHREQIVALAKQYKLATVCPLPDFIASGGLVSYGADLSLQMRHAAGYVDRILKGEKPADLPVQAPSKYNLLVNLKAANDMGLTIPPSVLARADEVIE
ncbi:MAG: ABC transporter substrate-binding protein [Xanthobacteraceae bacterium]